MESTVLTDGLTALRIDPAHADTLLAYLQCVLDKNTVMNLTAITDPDEAVKLHLLDCAALIPQYEFAGKSVIDVGCGAGFPGMPLRICEPSIRLTLLDATEKKIAFLKETVDALKLENITCIHARAEEYAVVPPKGMRESFDVAVSRAVARLNILAELCLPLVKMKGMFCAMKSAGSDEEINEAKSAIQKLGGQIAHVEDYTVPGTDVMHRAVWVEKVSATPGMYPRRFAKIKQLPL
ncbi:MAG: 16S rRNA (guanine(527)-N(7))-methyltransferase RsmG [Eubacteriales bacterium]|jgi:16S rRNA (guanine527-N7)-methyltransferase